MCIYYGNVCHAAIHILMQKIKKINMLTFPTNRHVIMISSSCKLTKALTSYRPENLITKQTVLLLLKTCLTKEIT